MKNLFLIALFAMISTLAFAQKEVKVEKEIENGKEITRVWVDGKEVKEGSAEYKKYAEGNIETNVWVEKRKGKKGKKGKEEKVIIIKKEVEDDVIIIGDEEEMDINVDVKKDGDNDKVIIKKKGKDGKVEVEEIIIKEGEDNVEVIELDGEGKKKMMFIQVEEDVEVTSGDDVEVTVDVKAEGEGKKKVIIKKKGKDGKEEIEELMIDDNGDETIIDGDTKVIIKTRKDTDFDLEGIDPEDIETVNVIKKDGVNQIIIKTKDGKTIVKDMGSDDKEVKVIKKRIRTEKTEDFDFDLDGLNPEDIETIDVKKTDDGKTVTIKTKDGKTIVKKIKEEKE